MCTKKGFHTIAAWQKADDLAVKVYEVTDLKTGCFPRHQSLSKFDWRTIFSKRLNSRTASSNHQHVRDFSQMLKRLRTPLASVLSLSLIFPFTPSVHDF